MNPLYSVWIHQIVQRQIQNLLSSPGIKREQLDKQIYNVFIKLKNDPVGKDNVPFHENKCQRLVGKIRKIYVGGAQRYRLMNLCLPDKKMVIPVYLSNVMRRDLDYDKIGWQDIAEEIYNDFLQGKENKFTKI